MRAFEPERWRSLIATLGVTPAEVAAAEAVDLDLLLKKKEVGHG
jgi:hypothetical protein